MTQRLAACWRALVAARAARRVAVRALPLALAVLLGLPGAAHALTQTRSPGTCVTGGGAGNAWGNPNNALTSNNADATVSVDGDVSEALQCTNYGFSLPAGANILGIEVNVERASNRTQNGGSRDSSLLLLGGTLAGSDLATATTYTTTDVVEAHGGATQTWGNSWTAAQINATGFGAALRVTKPSAGGAAHTVSVDHVQITVYYDLPAPTIVSATLVCGTTNQAEVVFSIPVTAATAQNAANYALSGGVTISSAVLDSGGQVVTLNTSPLSSGENYTLTVNNVASSSGGVIAANSQASFFSEGGYLSGLPGTYYNQNGVQRAYFTGAQAVRVDGQVNFDWAAGAPGPAGIGIDDFSVRWSGFVTAPVSGNYTFRTRSDDGVRLYVNGALVIDNWTDHSAANDDSGTIAMTAGTRVPIVMEFYERGGDAVAQLSWSGPATGGFEFIPRASLSHFCGVQGPVAFWKLDEATWSGSGAVVDSSGNGHDGSAAGGTVPVSARVCNGAQLNGSSRYLTVPNLSTLLGGTASLAFWIRTTQTGSDLAWQAPGVSGVELSGGTNDIFWGWLDASGRIGLSIGDTNTQKSTVAINNGAWRHVVLTRDATAGSFKIYVDGTLNNSGALATGTITTAFTSLGRIEDTAGTPEYLDGQLDEVRIYGAVLTDAEVAQIYNITRPCAGPDHYAIVGATTAVNCDVTTVQFTAHDAGHALVAPTAGSVLTLSTSTGTGVWVSRLAGGGAWAPSGANNGAATYTWPGGESSFSVTLRHNAVALVGINVIDVSGRTEAGAEDLAISFVNSAFRVTADGTSTGAIGTQISGKNSNTGFGAQTLYLQAIRTDTSTGSCVGVFQSQTVSIEMAGARINPTGSASQLSVLNSGGTMTALGTGAGAAGAYTSVSLAFDAQSKAPLVVNYPNAGSVSLFARYQLPAPPGGTYISGTSNAFVVRPFGLRISGPPNGRTGAGSTVYARAGATWPDLVTVSAVAWAAGEDANNDGIPDSDAVLAGNAVTTNFGAESTPATAAVTHALAEPSGGSSGTLTAALSAFTNGVATASASWSEVGLINLFATSTSYLGTGQNVRNSGTGYTGVGRFIPYDFAVARNTPMLQPACASGNFTYVGQPFNYATVPVLTVTARNQAGATTQNYAGSFMKIVNASITPSASQAARYSRFDALGGGTTPALDVGALPAVAGDPAIGAFAGGVGTLTFSGGGGFVLTRATPVAPFNADIGLSFSLTDGDGVVVGSIDGSAGANPVQFGTTSAAGNGMAFVGGARAMRFGRLRLQSANGSERLPLSMRVSARYWNGSGFVANALDSCTTLSAANVALGNYRGNLAAGETTVSVPAATLAGGVGSLRFSAPGAGNEGSVDVSLNLGGLAAGTSCLGGMGASTGANLAWLQGAWCGAAYDDDPSARATFGIYRAGDRIIYLRENY
jgi:hypothetical protein